ncbi:MAG: hypothetical protein KQJ78_24065 [Deltaproteobacteria bacterium]|nr:hypothetical protein [Deltaproteobacteria bacterium]
MKYLAGRKSCPALARNPGDGPSDVPPALIINEAQLLLAEKRTILATLRTGIVVMTLPLALVSFLIAASTHYELEKVLQYLVPLLAVCGLLMILGAFLVIRSFLKFLRTDRILQQLKRDHGFLTSVMD